MRMCLCIFTKACIFHVIASWYVNVKYVYFKPLILCTLLFYIVNVFKTVLHVFECLYFSTYVILPLRWFCVHNMCIFCAFSVCVYVCVCVCVYTRTRVRVYMFARLNLCRGLQCRYDCVSRIYHVLGFTLVTVDDSQALCPNSYCHHHHHHHHFHHHRRRRCRHG